MVALRRVRDLAALADKTTLAPCGSKSGLLSDRRGICAGIEAAARSTGFAAIFRMAGTDQQFLGAPAAL